MSCCYRKEEFRRIMEYSPTGVERENSVYLYEDMESCFFGEEKVFFLNQEGDRSEEERFAYDTVETVLEGKEKKGCWYSKVGEEGYYVYPLDKEDREIIEDLPLLGFLRTKPFWTLLVSRIPGMEDYWFFF